MDNEVTANVPDGGWGWVVVAAVAFVNMTNQAIPSVFSFLFDSQLLAIGQQTSAAALIANINSLSLNLSGLFIGPAIKTFSPRKVAVSGCLFISLGLVMCSISNKVWQYIVGYSLMCGIGQGLIAPSTFMAVNSYFTTKRGRAVAICLAGSGLGQMIIPHIVRICLENYGFQGATLALALWSAIGLIGACTIKSFNTPLQKKYNNRKEVNLQLQTSKDEKLFTEVKFEQVSAITGETVGHKTKESRTKKICNKIFNRVIQAMDLELLNDPIFWSIIVGVALVYTSNTNFTMLFPYFLRNSLNLSPPDTAFCMSVIAGSDICSRLILPFITDKLKIRYRTIFLFGIIGLLISHAALAESTTMATVIILSVLSGMSKSATVINNNLVISEYCQPEKLPGGLGLNMISKAVLVITVGQLLGWVRDYSGSYTVCMHAQNLVFALVIVIWSCENLALYWRKQRRANALQIDPEAAHEEECVELTGKLNC